jgi:hypothetical protein
MAPVENTGPITITPKRPSKAVLKRGLKAVSEACGASACIIHEPDGKTLIVPCIPPTNINVKEQDVEFKL